MPPAIEKIAADAEFVGDLGVDFEGCWSRNLEHLNRLAERSRCKDARHAYFGMERSTHALLMAVGGVS